MNDSLFHKKSILKKFGTCILFAALFIYGPADVLADFEDGLLASHKGDYLTALREFRGLAEQGHTKAQVQLGIMYEMGLGVKQDYPEASEWYQKAAIQGDKDARKRLIEMRQKGLATIFQPQIPENWQGNATDQQSQYDIGVMYFRGIGVTKDYAMAYRWFYMAASQGHAKAQNDLAVLLSKGLGTRQNKSEAYIWYLRAAEQGFADAQYNLGVMLSYGTESGMEQHFIIAYMWFEIAAQNGILEARNDQVRLAKEMKASQLEEAKTEARKWLTKYRQGK